MTTPKSHSKRLGEIRDAGRRQRTDQHHVDARGDESRFQRRLEHVAGDRVSLPTSTVPPLGASTRAAELANRNANSRSADARLRGHVCIGAKVFTAHYLESLEVNRNW